MNEDMLGRTLTIGNFVAVAHKQSGLTIMQIAGIKKMVSLKIIDPKDSPWDQRGKSFEKVRIHRQASNLLRIDPDKEPELSLKILKMKKIV